MFQAHALHALWLLATFVTHRTLITQRICRSESSRISLGLAATAFGLAGLVDWLSVFPEYSHWFLPGVYLVFDWGIVGLIALGSFLFMRAIELRKDGEVGQQEIGKGARVVEGKHPSDQLSYLLTTEELRRALAQPYPFVEMAAVALDRLLSVARNDGEAGSVGGAIYLFNDTTGKMTLVSATNLAPEEESALEELGLQEPLLSESFATGGATLSHNFRQCSGPDGTARSCALAIPFTLDEKPLGCAIALSATSIALSAERKRALYSLAGIISERFHLVKLRGELRREKKRTERAQSSGESWLSLVASLASCEWDTDSLGDVCERLGARCGGDNCAVIVDTGGALDVVVGRTATRTSITEIDSSILAACRQALGANNAALLTRRTEAGQKNIGVVAPFRLLTANQPLYAALVWNDERAFNLSGTEWRGIQATLAALSLLPATKSAGASNAGLLERVHELLSEGDSQREISQELEAFLLALGKSFDSLLAALLYAKDERGRLRPVSAVGVSLEDLGEVVILPGEGALGRAAAVGVESVASGARRLDELCAEYDMMNRDFFGERFAALGRPEGEIVLPLKVNARNEYALAVYVDDSNDIKRTAREIRILGAIESLKLSALDLQAERFAPVADLKDPANARRLGMTYNNVNNDLSAIVGNCQLVGSDPNLTGEVERALRIIQERAESAAGRLRAVSLPTALESGSHDTIGVFQSTEQEPGVSLTEALRTFADSALVGGDILLTDNKARELSLDISTDIRVNLNESGVTQLAEELCRRFTALAGERERVTLTTYRNATHQCLDLSRHRREFPPLTGAAEFAHYSAPTDQFFGLPARLCESLRSAGVEFAVDDSDETPAYLSLRAPLAVTDKANDGKKSTESKAIRILAVDDQSMILDLLQGMCQSMGYEVVVSSSPREALEEFRRKKFEIVISDIAMPEMSGWDVAEAIRELNADTQIIFITGWGEGIRPEELEAAGVSQIIYKPFRIEQLAEALERARAERLSI